MALALILNNLYQVQKQMQHFYLMTRILQVHLLKIEAQ